MNLRSPKLALLVGALTLLEGCAVAASPALGLGGARQAAGEALRLSERGAQLVGIGYAVISVQNHANPEQRRLLAIRSSKLDAYRALEDVRWASRGPGSPRTRRGNPDADSHLGTRCRILRSPGFSRSFCSSRSSPRPPWRTQTTRVDAALWTDTV